MKWLSNTHIEDGIKSHRDWLRGKIIGDPQATNRHSVEELKKMGMVGVYQADREEGSRA